MRKFTSCSDLVLSWPRRRYITAWIASEFSLGSGAGRVCVEVLSLHHVFQAAFSGGLPLNRLLRSKFIIPGFYPKLLCALRRPKLRANFHLRLWEQAGFHRRIASRFQIKLLTSMKRIQRNQDQIVETKRKSRSRILHQINLKSRISRTQHQTKSNILKCQGL